MYWKQCVLDGAAWKPGIVGPDKLPWGQVMKKHADLLGVKMGTFSAQFHTTERLFTLERVIANPEVASNHLPTKHSDEDLSLLYTMTKARIHQLDDKIAAIECYQSQFVQGRPSQSPTFIEQLRDEAAFWGKSIGTQYGEPITSREPVGLRSLTELV